jgi:hypothetical protein
MKDGLAMTGRPGVSCFLIEPAAIIRRAYGPKPFVTIGRRALGISCQVKLQINTGFFVARSIARNRYTQIWRSNVLSVSLPSRAMGNAFVIDAVTTWALIMNR